MNQLIRHIEYLISRNDCVIIPGLGALLAQYCPARIDETTGMVKPPCRHFTFNSGIRDNDATLALSISRASGISFQRAFDYVNKEVDSMRHQLHSFGSLSLGRVGTLHYNAPDGTCDFESFAVDRLSVATAWLPVVSATQLKSNHRAYDSSMNKVTRPVWSRISRIAAVAAMLIGVWLVASTPISIDNESLLSASLAPNISRATSAPAILSATQKEVPSDLTSELSQDEDMLSETLAETTVPSLANANETVSDNGEIMDMEKGRFYIIVGASVSAKGAQKFIDMHPDIKDEANIVRYGHKHVVSVSVYDTPEEANSACIKTRKTYPDAWIGTN